MSFDLIAILLGIAGIAAFIIYLIWQRRYRRQADRKLREEFGKENHGK